MRRTDGLLLWLHIHHEPFRFAITALTTVVIASGGQLPNVGYRRSDFRERMEWWSMVRQTEESAFPLDPFPKPERLRIFSDPSHDAYVGKGE